MYKINTEGIGDVKKYVWHYKKEDKGYGPFTYEDIVGLVKKGEIGPEDYVMKFGTRRFVKASEVQGLFEVSEQPGEHSEGFQEKMPRVPIDKKEEMSVVVEYKEVDTEKSSKQDVKGSKVVVFIAVVLGLGLVIWVLQKLL